MRSFLTHRRRVGLLRAALRSGNPCVPSCRKAVPPATGGCPSHPSPNHFATCTNWVYSHTASYIKSDTPLPAEVDILPL
ncbi:MAG: hypothetical protein NZM35_04940 [Chitinophagales bacterium]|nr:hypothetical protein [Chitinophagales bacterium]MDW8418569.1 hypothetical protein [Chitinophagales bacterium]